MVQITVVFLAYCIAGKLGQATTNIRSSNLGPVWPAYGIALAAFLAYGSRVWPGIAASAFVVSILSAVPHSPQPVKRVEPRSPRSPVRSSCVASVASIRRSHDCATRWG